MRFASNIELLALEQQVLEEVEKKYMKKGGENTQDSDVLKSEEWYKYWCPIAKEQCRGAKCAFFKVVKTDKDNVYGKCKKR